MPELPEVESVVRSLRPLLVGRTIEELMVPAERRAGEWPATLRRLLDSPPARLREQVRGTRIAAVGRIGKNIQISLVPLAATGDAENASPAAPRTLWVHLGMTGRLTSEDSEVPASKHTHLIFVLGGAPATASAARFGWLHFADIRRFGRVRLTVDSPASAAPHGRPLSKLGPEPMDIAAEEFARRLRARRTRLKALLLDQSFVSGLGNIYADESLFRAGLHPLKIAATLKPAQATALHASAQTVLREAIAAGGSSISDYVDGQGRQGWFQIHHNVYQRTGEPCHSCATPIRKIVVGGRSTHFCPRCQPGRVPRVLKRATKPRAAQSAVKRDSRPKGARR